MASAIPAALVAGYADKSGNRTADPTSNHCCTDRSTLSFMLLRYSSLLLTIGVVLLAAGGPSVAAQEGQPEASADRKAAAEQTIRVEQVRIGFDGKYKAGFWAPVTLTLSAGGQQPVEGELSILATDGDNVPVVYPNERKQAIVAGDTAQQHLRYFRMGPQRGKLAAQLQAGDSGKVIWSQSLRDLTPPPLAATQELLVTIGPDLGLDAALKLSRRPEGQGAVAARVAQVAELPDRWWGYEGVDWLFLPTRDRSLVDSLSDDQFEALRQWVLMGGRLVLSVGAEGESLLADGSRWRTFAPGPLSEVRPLRDRAGFESFTNTELPWDNEEFQRNRPLIAAFEQFEGRTEVDEGGVAQGQPLALRRTYGFGHILFLSFDLDDPQLAAWAGRPRLINNLLQRWQSPVEDGTRQGRQAVQHLGFEDLSGQMRAALEQFPGITVVNVATVAVLTLAYLLLIGPADFFLFRRTGLPAYGAWITFPLTVVGFCLAAWYMATSAHGNALRINEAEVVDIDTTQQVVRAHTWNHLYSPRAAQYDVALAVDGGSIGVDAAPLGWLSWQGLPGSGLGGLASQQVSLIESPAYTVDPPDQDPAIHRLPVPVASSKALASRWWGKSDATPVSELTVNEFGLPRGELRNPFQFDLDECLLAYDEWLFRLQKIPAGRSVSLEDFPSLNLEARLTQRTVVDAKDITTPWDQASVDVPRIMQMLLFHETARGRGYTGLTHKYLGPLDLTEHIRSGRAIFVGRANQPISQLTVDGAASENIGAKQQWTWVRFVLPVDTRGDRR